MQADDPYGGLIYSIRTSNGHDSSNTALSVGSRGCQAQRVVDYHPCLFCSCSSFPRLLLWYPSMVSLCGTLPLGVLSLRLLPLGLLLLYFLGHSPLGDLSLSTIFVGLLLLSLGLGLFLLTPPPLSFGISSSIPGSSLLGVLALDHFSLVSVFK